MSAKTHRAAALLTPLARCEAVCRRSAEPAGVGIVNRLLTQPYSLIRECSRSSRSMNASIASYTRRTTYGETPSRMARSRSRIIGWFCGVPSL